MGWKEGVRTQALSNFWKWNERSRAWLSEVSAHFSTFDSGTVSSSGCSLGLSGIEHPSSGKEGGGNSFISKAMLSQNFAIIMSFSLMPGGV